MPEVQDLSLEDLLDQELRDGARCPVAKALDGLNVADHATFDRAIRDPEHVSHAALARVLGKKLGRKLEARPVARHRMYVLGLVNDSDPCSCHD